MMYGYGTAAWWMILMPLLWIVLIGAVAWAVVKMVRPAPVAGPIGAAPTARQILDRRYAAGEIDETTYTRMRARLSDTEPGAS